MKKRIRHVSELPSWFNLEKYEFTKNLDSLGWFKQLITRELHFIKADDISSNISIESEQEQTLKKILPLVRNDPHLFVEDHIVLSSHSRLHSSTPEENPTKPEQILCVHPVKSRKTSAKPMTGIYQVNYNFSDDFLIENFKQCLAIARTKHSSHYPAPYRKSDFKNWEKLGILPYIDLFIWSVEEKIHITHRVLADALYPYGDKGEETIRKTTIPLAEKIVSQCSLVQLHAQAAICIVEKNSC